MLLGVHHHLMERARRGQEEEEEDGEEGGDGKCESPDLQACALMEQLDITSMCNDRRLCISVIDV